MINLSKKRVSRDANDQLLGVVAIIVVAVFVVGVIIIFAKSLFSGVESDLPIGLDTATVSNAETQTPDEKTSEKSTKKKKTTKADADSDKDSEDKETTTTTAAGMGTKSVLEYAYLRKEPNAEAEAIICMSPGIQVTVLSEPDEGGYVKATFTDVSGQLTGYVHESYLG